MSTKFTAIILAVAAILFAFIYFVEMPVKRAAEIPTDQSVLPGLDPAKVTSIEIQRDGNVISLEKTDNTWQITQPVPYPASSRMVMGVLREMSNWQWDSTIENPTSWEDYGLVKDQFTLSLRQGDDTHTLKIGNISPVGDKVYLSLPGSYRVFVAKRDKLDFIFTNDTFWRDLTLMNLNTNPFQRLQVRGTNDDIMELKLDPVTLLWRMTQPVEARADTVKINNLLTRLQCTPISGFVETGSLPAKPLTLTFLRGNSGTNKAAELRIGTRFIEPHDDLVMAGRLYPPGLFAISNAAVAPWEGDYTNFLDRHLISVPPDTITSIEAEGSATEKFTVQKTEAGPWLVTCTNGESFLADEILMKNWLAALTNIQVVSGRSAELVLSPFGLDKPSSALLHVQVRFENAPTNLATTDLLFGLGTNLPAQIYEMGNGERMVNTIDADSLSRMPRFYWELRDRSIWHFSTNEVVAIDIHQKGRDIRYTRATNGIWKGPENYAVDLISPAIEETVDEIGRLKAIYWSGPGDNRSDPFGFNDTDYRLSFELARNGQMQTNTIQFGHSSAHLHPYASVLRDGRHLVFEFPIDLYANWVQACLSVPTMYWLTR